MTLAPTLTPTVRPAGLTAVSVVLGFLAIGALLDATFMPIALLNLGPRLPSSPFRVSWAIACAAIAITAAIYGTCGLAASIGLWKMRPWAPRAYLAWLVSVVFCTVALISIARIPPGDLTSQDFVPVAISVAGVLAVLAAGYIYIRRSLSRHHKAEGPTTARHDP